MKISRADPNNHEQQPDNMDPLPTVYNITSVEVHQQGGHQDEEDVGDSVDELCNVWRECVVFLTPVYRAGARGKVERHLANIRHCSTHWQESERNHSSYQIMANFSTSTN